MNTLSSNIFFGFQFKYLKTWSNVLAYFKHNIRAIPILNADPDKTSLNRLLCGTRDMDPLAWCQERLKNTTVRKNGILTAAFLFDVTPEYFRPDREENYGEYLPERVNSWTEATREWMEETFGGLVYSAALHLDEATPHIHALFLPLTPDGKLSWNHFFCRNMRFEDYVYLYSLKIRHLGIKYPKQTFSGGILSRIAGYYLYVSQSQSPSCILRPVNLPQLPVLNKALRYLPPAVKKAARNIALTVLSLLKAIKLNLWENCKKKLIIINKYLDIQYNNATLLKHKNNELYKLQLYILDKLPKYWTAKSPWVQPADKTAEMTSDRPALDREAAEGRPRSPRSPRSRRKKTGSASRLELYCLDEDYILAVKDDFFQDLKKKTQGRGSIEFFSSLFDYSEENWHQVAKMLPEMIKKAQISANFYTRYISQCIAKYSLRFVRQRMAQAVEICLLPGCSPQMFSLSPETVSQVLAQAEAVPDGPARAPEPVFNEPKKPRTESEKDRLKENSLPVRRYFPRD